MMGATQYGRLNIEDELRCRVDILPPVDVNALGDQLARQQSALALHLVVQAEQVVDARSIEIALLAGLTERRIPDRAIFFQTALDTERR